MTITYNVIIKSNGALIVERYAQYMRGEGFKAVMYCDDVVIWFIQFALSFRNA